MSTVAIKEQQNIEVYSNDNGQIVIKTSNLHDRDAYIVFWPEFSDALIAAILKEKAELEDGAPIQASFA